MSKTQQPLFTTSESTILSRVMLRLSDLGARVFRNNVGVATAPNGAVIRYGLCNGSSDLIGWKTVTITSDMVGKSVALFVAVEVKSLKGRASSEQKNFIERVKQSGGIAGIVKNEAEAEVLINTHKP